MSFHRYRGSELRINKLLSIRARSYDSAHKHWKHTTGLLYDSVPVQSL